MMGATQEAYRVLLQLFPAQTQVQPEHLPDCCSEESHQQLADRAMIQLCWPRTQRAPNPGRSKWISR